MMRAEGLLSREWHAGVESLPRTRAECSGLVNGKPRVRKFSCNTGQRSGQAEGLPETWLRTSGRTKLQVSRVCRGRTATSLRAAVIVFARFS